MDDLGKFFCVNKKCSMYGIRDGENIHVRAWSGKHKDIRLLHCRVCKKKFSERRGTVLSDSRLPAEKAVSLLEHVVEGNGMRKTGRLVKVGHMTVSRYTKLAGEHSETLHDELVAFSPNTQEIQFDEKWRFVRKKEKHGDADNPADARCGDNWDHVSLDAETKLVLQVVNGKRTKKNMKRLVRKTAKYLKNKLPRLITSDEWQAYERAILEAFGECLVPPPTGLRGRPRRPLLVPPEGLVYATVHKTRVKGRVTKISYRTILGTDEQVQEALKTSRCSRKVNTALIERQNGTDRNRCSRKVRKTYCFSKDWEVHEAATRLSLYSYNFCWAVRTLRRPDGQKGKCTPAMAGLAENVWTIREGITFPGCKC